MKRAQANRAIIAARAAAAGRTGRHSQITVLAPSTVTATGPVKRTRCAPMTKAQRNSEGRRSEWAASPYYWTDPKWSATLTR